MLLTLSWICSTSSPILPLLLKGVPAEKLSHGGEGGEGVSGLVDTLLQHAGNVPFQALLLLLFKEVAFLVPGEVGLRLCC